MKIAFLGAGNMASAMVEGLRRGSVNATGTNPNRFEGESLVCYTASGKSAAALAARTGIAQARSLDELVEGADALVVAFKPQHLASADARLGELTAGVLVVSVLAGKRLGFLRKSFPRARAIVRTMPNTPARIGAGITGWCSEGPLSPGDRELLQTLLDAMGESVEVAENQMDALTAVSGSGPAYVFEFAAALREAGAAAGLPPETAARLASSTLLGAARLMASRGEAPEKLRDEVTSPNGTTFAGLRRLEAGGFRELIAQTVLAAKTRAQELAAEELPPPMNPLDGRILVTGGAGFIGSALVWALNRRGCRNILIADLLGSDEKWRNLTPLRFVDYCEADAFRRKLDSDPKSFGAFSCVFHLGACSSTTERNAAYLADNNYAYTRELAVWALGQDARFIYASSAATYGDGAAGMSDTDPQLHRLRPLNMYGYSKHLFDLHAQAAGWLERIVGVKYFNVFGPNEEHKGDMRSLVSKAYGQIRETGSVRLFRSHRPDYRDGEQKRDFLYVKDAVEMTLHFAEEGRQAAGLYNLGSGEARTWIELADAIFAAMGKPSRIEFIDMPPALREKYQYFTQADISKLRAAGYARPMTPLAESVRDYVQGYLVPNRRLGDEAT